jgi:hypothetical protein
MTREITAFQRLTLDDDIDATELCAEAILRGDGMIAKYLAGADWESFKGLMCTDGHDEFKVYSHDFFKCADASEYEWKYEGPVIKFMCDIKKYFYVSGADVVYIHFR